MYDAKWLNGTQGTVAHNGHLVPPSPGKRGEVSPGRIYGWADAAIEELEGMAVTQPKYAKINSGVVREETLLFKKTTVGHR